VDSLTAVLLDTVSIQKYIFSSNRLKENLGASSIVENIFEKDIQDTIIGILPDLKERDDVFIRWKNSERGSFDLLDKDREVEVGYMGGGNAILFFRDDSTARAFARQFTRKVLIEKPGVKLALAIRKDVPVDEIEHHFKGFMTDMFERLTVNKNTYFPNVKLPKFGFTKDCPYSNESADTSIYEAEGVKRYVSSMTATKIERAKAIEKDNGPSGNSLLDAGMKRQLTNEIDQLGQKTGDNWIGVVHIDGNSMGKKFQSCGTLNELRDLSARVKAITRNSFKQLLKQLDDKINVSEEIETVIKKNDFLPVRPIVIGGDDVTFVCNANLALYLTEEFINIWTQNMNQSDLLIKDHDAKEPEVEFSACGGIAIVKTKYPFYQSYQMAEGLCSRAKKMVKGQKGEYSGLDFYIHQSSVAGDIDEIIRENYERDNGGILNHFGPYFVGENVPETVSKETMGELKKGIQHFRKWPRSKRKAFRDTLNTSETAARKLLKDLNARGLKVPGGQEALYVEHEEQRKTPYLDMIDGMEFYPEVVMKWRDTDDN